MVRMHSSTGLTVLVNFTFDRHARLDVLRRVRRALGDMPQVSEIVDLEGVSDLMIEADVESLASFHDQIERTIDPHRRFIRHYEVNFVLRTTRREDPHNLLWTPDRDGSRCVDLDRADCISAEGDYVRIRCDGKSALHHATLHSILERLPQPPFVQIHRSTIVNAACVRTIRHEGRRWLVELADGSTHAIAKGRHAEIVREVERVAGTAPAISSNLVQLDRPNRPFERKAALPRVDSA